MCYANDAAPRSNTDNATHFTTCESELACYKSLGSGVKYVSGQKKKMYTALGMDLPKNIKLPTENVEKQQIKTESLQNTQQISVLKPLRTHHFSISLQEGFMISPAPGQVSNPESWITRPAQRFHPHRHRRSNSTQSNIINSGK